MKTQRILRQKNKEFLKEDVIPINSHFEVLTGEDPSLKVPIETRREKNRFLITINPDLLRQWLSEAPDVLFSSLLLNDYMQFELCKQNLYWGKFEKAITHHSSNEFRQSLGMKVETMYTISAYNAIFQSLKLHNDNLLKYIADYINNRILSLITDGSIAIDFGQNEAPSSFKARCNQLFTNINLLPRLYDLFVRSHGEELTAEDFSLINSDPDYETIPSLCKVRHLYLNKDNQYLMKIMHLLFSQFNLSGHEDVDCCYDWFEKYSDKEPIPETMLPYFNELKEIGAVEIKDNHAENFKELEYVFPILNLLNIYSELNILPNCFSDEMTNSVNAMRECKFFIEDDNLFSKDGADYLKYALTDQKFVNNRALRNKYCHGGSVVASEETAAMDFFHGLILLTFIAITIHADLQMFQLCPNCRKDEIPEEAVRKLTQKPYQQAHE